ncbi:MAG: DUF488 domain-containing protein [Clostridiales bacterium]|nr:DUF488 domain-containing protein [Clostridiales bacterium]
MGKLFTVGHSVHKPDFFADLLNQYHINYLLDVRSTPYSRYAEWYNRENLSVWLKNLDIHYSFMGKYFGARQPEAELYSPEGYLDFEKVTASERFRIGLENVKKGLAQGNRIAFMCTEKDPIDCHRAIMVARAFELKGMEVEHILPDGSLQSQNELGQRLLQRYFPDRNQLSLFDFQNDISEEEYIKRAYRLRNAEIGYRREGGVAE